MTLVYAAAIDDVTFMVADTLLSFDVERNNRETMFSTGDHILKIHILNPSVAIAFAGAVDAALVLISKVNSLIKQNSNLNVAEALWELHNNYSTSLPDPTLADCEFLVLQINLLDKRLAKVTRAGVGYCERVYIGDSDEYRDMIKLRRHYEAPKFQHVQQPDGSFIHVPYVVTTGERESAEISDAMEALAHQRKSRTVGAICGCVTRVINARRSGELHYLQSIESTVSHEEGRSGYTYLASNSGNRGVGIYYRSGKMGFIFPACDDVSCRKEYADNLREFIDLASTKYGLSLVGGGWQD